MSLKDVRERLFSTDQAFSIYADNGELALNDQYTAHPFKNEYTSRWSPWFACCEGGYPDIFDEQAAGAWCRENEQASRIAIHFASDSKVLAHCLVVPRELRECFPSAHTVSVLFSKRQQTVPAEELAATMEGAFAKPETCFVKSKITSNRYSHALLAEQVPFREFDPLSSDLLLDRHGRVVQRSQYAIHPSVMLSKFPTPNHTDKTRSGEHAVRELLDSMRAFVGEILHHLEAEPGHETVHIDVQFSYGTERMLGVSFDNSDSQTLLSDAIELQFVIINIPL